MKNTILIFFSLFSILAWNNNASACWCQRITYYTEDEFRNAVVKEVRNSDAVFSGEVVGFDREKYEVKFRVAKVWKGDVAKADITLSYWYYTIIKDEVFIECSFQSFKVGKSYLLYADLFKKQFQVNDCSRSRFYDEAERDLNVLESLKPDEKQKEPINNGAIEQFNGREAETATLLFGLSFYPSRAW